MKHFVKYCQNNNIKNVTFNCVHPASTKTNLGNTGNRPYYLRPIFFLWGLFMTIPLDKATWSTVYAATSNELTGVNNKYIRPNGEEKVDETYYTEENEEKLWNYCLRICQQYLEN